jgi:hypothetical protein
VAPIVHHPGPQIFANELHEPVALVVTAKLGMIPFSMAPSIPIFDLQLI